MTDVEMGGERTGRANDGNADISHFQDGWVVLNTHPHRERSAQENLSRQGFEAYYPCILKRIRHARRVSHEHRPLFPSYIFARVDLKCWRPLASTIGVRSLVRCGDGVSLLGHDFITALKARETEGVVCAAANQLKVGQPVIIGGGAFEGLVATVFSLREAERVTVLMTLLSRSVKVNVAARDLVPILASQHQRT